MKNFATSILLSTLVFAMPWARAQLPPACETKKLTEVKSLAALPDEVATLLGAKRGGFEGIADRNEKFNVTDVISDQQLPRNRFILGAVGVNCALVAIEHGGRGHWFETVSFEQIQTKWQIKQRSVISAAPRSFAELVAHDEK